MSTFNVLKQRPHFQDGTFWPLQTSSKHFTQRTTFPGWCYLFPSPGGTNSSFLAIYLFPLQRSKFQFSAGSIPIFGRHIDSKLFSLVFRGADFRFLPLIIGGTHISNFPASSDTNFQTKDLCLSF